MKITRKKPEFTPIVITLETEQEATVFIGLIDRIDRAKLSINLTSFEHELVRKLSDIFTDIGGV